ncbi:MAG: hypothetical protein ACRD15_02645, partial [Vicinamibacterales bacterium]
ILRGQAMTIFGSSNWSESSSQSQLEHNYFTRKAWILQWFIDQFERKWNNSAGALETTNFVPLPPDMPRTPSPAHNATGTTTTPTLKWYGGPWAHLYDVYLGTTSTPPLFASNLALGPSQRSGQMQSYVIPSQLAQGTTYYWRIVAKTMALQPRSSPIWSFTTSGSPAAVRPVAATLVSPIGVSSPADPTFIWNAVGNATYYYLWINDSTGRRFATWYRRDQVRCPTGAGRCSLAPLTPLRPGRITWWIQTWNPEGGYGPWSSGVSFTLQPLSTPRLISPSGSLAEGPDVLFRWNAVPGATHHYLWITDGSGTVRWRTWYTTAATGCAGGGVCSVSLRLALSPGTATWWVQAWNYTAGYSSWSAPVRFVRP